MASSEDVIRSAVPGGIGKPLILALLALVASENSIHLSRSYRRIRT
jgi:hypothetical protein